ncbi:MAG: hypothetical protein ACLUDD_04840 [Lactobacillus kalixensis]|uniref:hypothetical protein n=1 Tax=Lactobacillus kalixensis TaxID=227944 RepID=UPI0039968F81
MSNPLFYYKNGIKYGQLKDFNAKYYQFSPTINAYGNLFGWDLSDDLSSLFGKTLIMFLVSYDANSDFSEWSVSKPFLFSENGFNQATLISDNNTTVNISVMGTSGAQLNSDIFTGYRRRAAVIFLAFD